MTTLHNGLLRTAIVLTCLLALPIHLHSGEGQSEVEQPLPPPKAPSPYFMSALWNEEDGIVRMSATNAVLTMTGKRMSTRTEERGFQVSRQDVIASFASGKTIDNAELPALLTKQTRVVVSMDAKPVDPTYLSLFREDTIILQIKELPFLFGVAGPRFDTGNNAVSVTLR